MPFEREFRLEILNEPKNEWCDVRLTGSLPWQGVLDLQQVLLKGPLPKGVKPNSGVKLGLQLKGRRRTLADCGVHSMD